jgi:hypothetical protein
MGRLRFGLLGVFESCCVIFLAVKLGSCGEIRLLRREALQP